MVASNRRTRPETIFAVSCHIVVSLFAIMSILPFINVLALSLSSKEAVLSGRVSLYPIGIQLKTFGNILNQGTLLKSMRNSVIITVVGTLLSMLVTTTMAYPLSKRCLRIKRPILILVIFTMIFDAGIIPHYLLIKNLGLLDTWWALWLPKASSAFNLIVLVNFFRALPDELDESAKLDGANDIVVLFKIILPVSGAALATITLFFMVNYWNIFFHALIYLSSSSKYPLQLRLREIINLSNVDQFMVDAMVDGEEIPVEQNIKSAAIIISTVPILLVYPYLQKYFMKGVMIGSIKG